MKIPSEAIIAREKLTRYLLVFQPENDKSKFLGLAGFTQDNPDALEAALRELIAEENAQFERHESYGDFYRVEGLLKGVSGHHLQVITIWIRRDEEGEKAHYRFVTLMPGKKAE